MGRLGFWILAAALFLTGAWAAPARAEVADDYDARALIPAEDAGLVDAGLVDAGLVDAGLDGVVLRRRGADEVRCFDPFRPKRRPDGTCCPPPPKPELRPDPCTPLEPCAPIDYCVSPFKLKLGLGLSLAQGNSDKFDLVVSGEAIYDRRPWAVEMGWLYAYGESAGVTATDAFHWELHADRDLNEPWHVFGHVSFDSDVIAALQHRWIGILGLGYTFFEGIGTYLKGEVGGGYTIEKRRFMAETSDPSGFAGLEYMRAFRNGIDFDASARFFPNFGTFDLSLIVLEASLAVPLSKTFSIALKTRVDHVLDAPPPASNTDIILSLGIQAEL